MKGFFVFITGVLAVTGVVATSAGAQEKAAPAASSAVPAVAAPAAGPISVGQSCPELVLKGVDGAAVKLNAEAFKKFDKTAIVFINTACTACRQELILVNKLAQKNPKLKVYGVSVDMAGKEAVEAYQKRMNFELDYLLDPEFLVGPRFGLNYTPGLVVVDKGGKVAGISSGFTAGKDDDKVIKLLE